ncbi:hypothetical protein LTR78_009829 [Recurvomyces mirabilis]|uniref:PDZ GRASP-type domain-containing protein n=1 Tax=Recurvomyces mirabilis TaxID=574656 RepID=A0AAE0TMK0_9PEZI|nr:hypothetical protein LTR78_009829 [Recurvomyces mirabilis]KAK5153065.1 hypothetical protein LTS14_007709 [Recurvomyces mirabilis]
MANLFGTLNRFISRLDSDPSSTTTTTTTNQHSSHSGTTSGSGFQVLRNTSPDLPLEPWFDFIIGINGRNIDNPDPALFATEIRNCAGSTISLGVYTAKGQTVRELYVPIPPPTTTTTREGKGSGLGLALQWGSLTQTNDVWHILDVMPNSPADVAGLLPYGDYVIGSPDGPLRGDAGLNSLIDSFTDRPLRLFVYNHEYDVTRLVTITPSRNWGGEGALGCVLGFGALHRVPAPLGEPAQGPGEMLFEASSGRDPPPYNAAGSSAPPPPRSSSVAQSNPADFFIPANAETPAITTTTSSAPPPPPPSGRGKEPPRSHPAAAIPGLDDYFAEGEAKSRELEGSRGNTPKPGGVGLPPPPSSSAAKGGPPRGVSPKPVVVADVAAADEDEGEDEDIA